LTPFPLRRREHYNRNGKAPAGRLAITGGREDRPELPIPTLKSGRKLTGPKLDPLLKGFGGDSPAKLRREKGKVLQTNQTRIA